MPKAKSPSQSSSSSSASSNLLTYEADVPSGMERLAAAEINALPQVQNVQVGVGAIRFQRPDIRVNVVQQLKLVTAVYLSQVYPVPRPKALLGHQHFQGLLKQMETAIQHEPGAPFRTFHLAAAGDDSSVMQRLKTELTAATHLQSDDEGGDVWIRLRRDKDRIGWEALVRISRRPHATRAWRVRDWAGALNAVIAQAVVRLTKPEPEDVFLNIGSGSGTILIERGLSGPAQALIGCDVSGSVLEVAQTNARAVPNLEFEWLHTDARQLPLADQSVDALAADLPFGVLIGSQDENMRLYPALLAEAARVAKPGARFVIITQAIRVMDLVLPSQTAWTVAEVLKVTQGGLHPRIYVLIRPGN
jgi:tRNA (guanine6-N2)-methyltransferase